ncbi:MAG TPA: ribonuclease Y [Anaerohalosphaeraceae bacterium]|nr:ribonuclease Y [Anaerohalosphaeraceae bacterium]HOL30707.1 ribonuclease Y [Anaerohalosphaeraceae bacterium]HOM75139.1 ribonuclease Y [Anaerohalosphaeraceae bacterium]HPC63448.1 ribonuclease Y [Anaerohalosphaeraceae bacterium]HRS72637.1 ribonuclease Y [Anaerohalosphaeraceae bacterium]
MEILAQMSVATSIFIGVVIGILAGGGIVFVVLQGIIKTRAKVTQEEIEARIETAKKQAETILKEARLDAAGEIMKKRQEFSAEVSSRENQLRMQELELTKKQDLLERQQEKIQQQEKQLANKDRELERQINTYNNRNKELANLVAQQKNMLLKITSLDVEQAKEMLLSRLEDECEREMNQLIQRKTAQAEEMAEEKAKEIINLAIQRYAAEQTCEVSVSMVDIPSDDMKGRVIGREGRNIRAFEKATGVDVIVDDTPGVIVVSGFNPIRREVARLSMERLIQDGRIHPSRIEEIVSQAKKDVHSRVIQLGKEAAEEVDVRGLNNKIIGMLGALHYRTSYGQNVLRHSVEVAFLAQVMADELGLDGSLAKRAGLLHDIGKAMDREIEGGHPAIGANFLRRFKESNVILNAVEAHHGDIPADNPYTPLVAAADAISASRPGARRETLERYIKRLEKLEEIAAGFEGVENCYAIQAGREIRVIVDAEKVSDDVAMKTARDIAKKIEDEMTYPGEIKVTLLREVRCVEYAR